MIYSVDEHRAEQAARHADKPVKPRSAPKVDADTPGEEIAVSGASEPEEVPE